MNIGVYFEVGGLNTLTTSDSIIDQYATLAQAESQSHSENVKFGMRRRMESGRTRLNHTQFLVYKGGRWRTQGRSGGSGDRAENL